jgi:hypothetical protein
VRRGQFHALVSFLSEDDFEFRLEEFDSFISEIFWARMPLFEQRRQPGKEEENDKRPEDVRALGIEL